MLTQEMINNAITGDERALLQIRKHYDAYINSICRESLKLSSGEEIKVINTEMEGEITTHLFLQIIRLGEKNGKGAIEHK